MVHVRQGGVERLKFKILNPLYIFGFIVGYLSKQTCRKIGLDCFWRRGGGFGAAGALP